MRALLLGLVFTVACAANQKFVNVAAVRTDINQTIAGSSNHRTIVSMGHTTETSAVVYTQAGKDSPRSEETWEKGAGGWSLKDTKVLADTGGAPSTGDAH